MPRSGVDRLPNPVKNARRFVPVRPLWPVFPMRDPNLSRAHRLARAACVLLLTSLSLAAVPPAAAHHDWAFHLESGSPRNDPDRVVATITGSGSITLATLPVVGPVTIPTGTDSVQLRNHFWEEKADCDSLRWQYEESTYFAQNVEAEGNQFKGTHTRDGGGYWVPGDNTGEHNGEHEYDAPEVSEWWYQGVEYFGLIEVTVETSGGTGPDPGTYYPAIWHLRLDGSNPAGGRMTWDGEGRGDYYFLYEQTALHDACDTNGGSATDALLAGADAESAGTAGLLLGLGLGAAGLVLGEAAAAEQVALDCAGFEEGTACRTARDAANGCAAGVDGSPCKPVIDCAGFEPGTLCYTAQKAYQDCLGRSNPTCDALFDLVDGCVAAVGGPGSGPCATAKAVVALAVAIVTGCLAGQDPAGVNACGAVQDCLANVVVCSGVPALIGQTCGPSGATGCEAIVVGLVNTAVNAVLTLVQNLCGPSGATSCIQTVTALANSVVAAAQEAVRNLCGTGALACVAPVIATVVALEGTVIALVQDLVSNPPGGNLLATAIALVQELISNPPGGNLLQVLLQLVDDVRRSLT